MQPTSDQPQPEDNPSEQYQPYPPAGTTPYPQAGDAPNQAPQQAPQQAPYQAPYQAPAQYPAPYGAPAPPPAPLTEQWWAAKEGGPAPAPTATVRRGRPWLVALVAFATFFVLIAGLGNQWVTDAIARHATGNSFQDYAIRSITTYGWRFSPRGDSDFARVWVAGLSMVGTALVLTLLLVGVVCRGRGGFWQAFFGTWMTVVVATLLAGYVRAAVIDDHRLFNQANQNNKAIVMFFSPLAPNASNLFAGLCFGLVVALLAGLAAALSRRTDVVGAPVMAAPPPEPERTGVEQPAPAPYQPGPEPGVADEPQHTAVLPAADEPADEHTTQLPRTDQTPDSQHTTQLPRSTPDGTDDGEAGPRHLSD